MIGLYKRLVILHKVAKDLKEASYLAVDAELICICGPDFLEV